MTTERVELITSLVILGSTVFALFKLNKIHVLVNSQFHALEKRVAQLIAALEGSDTEVPEVEKEGKEV